MKLVLSILRNLAVSVILIVPIINRNPNSIVEDSDKYCKEVFCYERTEREKVVYT